MINKGILLLFLFFGIILVIIEITKVDRVCPQQKIIYRYIPRTFEEEMSEPVYPSQIFKSMFTAPSQYVHGIGEYDQRKKEKVNQFYISQM